MNSIGIIGGADGPTAILVSSNFPLWVYAVGIVAFLGVVIAIIAAFKK